MRLNDVISLTAVQRRRLRAWGRIQKRGPRERRKEFSRDELLDYLKQGNIRSWRVLVKKRRRGDPALYDYRKMFGNWSAAVEAAFGKTLKPDVDVMYVLRAVPYFDAWTWRQYLAARKAHPDILPSSRFILREFRSFGEFVACARGVSLKQTMMAYRAVWMKLGHRPTIEECRNQGVRLEFAIEFFRGKAGLDKLIADMVDKDEDTQA